MRVEISSEESDGTRTKAAIRPNRVSVTRSPKQAAKGGDMLSGSRLYLLQIIIIEHIKDPSIRALVDADADAIASTVKILQSFAKCYN